MTRGMKIRSIVLIVTVCVVLASPMALFVADRGLKLDLPDWMTAQSSSYLSGGIKKASIKKNLCLEGWNSKALQGAVETTVGNNIPFKASALLGNAFLQRQAIAASNMLFCFDVYPAYFGSSGSYNPGQNALSAYPISGKNGFIDDVRATGTQLAEFASRHPDIQFCLVMADQSDYSDANPVSRLVSSRVSTKDCAEALRGAIKGCENVSLVCIAYDDADEYYRNYYRSDHHWNGWGALAAYNEVKSIMNLKDVVLKSEEPVLFAGYPCNGSYAREDLFLINESPAEPALDVSCFVPEGSGAPYIIREDAANALMATGMKAQFDFYPQWYGAAATVAKYPLENAALDDGSRATVLQDSYNDAFHWLLGLNYQTTTSYSDLKADRTDTTPLAERVRDSDPDVIYFVGNCGAYQRLLKKAPGYFEE